MNFNQIAKQAVTFQKAAFTSLCNAVAIIQDQSASAMEGMMNQPGLAMPAEVQKAIKSWVNACQEELKRFHSCAESNFSILEKCFVQEATPVVPEKPPAVQEIKPVSDASPKTAAKEKKAAPAKPVTREELIKKQFDVVSPEILYRVPEAMVEASVFTAPELLTGMNTEDAKRIKVLLANTYSEADLKAAAEKPTPAKSPTPSAQKKVKPTPKTKRAAR